MARISAHDDPDYVIQGCYHGDNATIAETDGSDAETEAVSMARKMLKDPAFEGDYVRVITRDGELVYDSRGTLDDHTHTGPYYNFPE